MPWSQSGMVPALGSAGGYQRSMDAASHLGWSQPWAMPHACCHAMHAGAAQQARQAAPPLPLPASQPAACTGCTHVHAEPVWACLYDTVTMACLTWEDGMAMTTCWHPSWYSAGGWSSSGGDGGAELL